MKTPLKVVTLFAVLSVLLFSSQAFAENCCPPSKGEIRGKTVVSGLLSLLIWPGIGQAVNDTSGEKAVTHAVLGLLPPYRIWSGYDALVDRKGGYWNGKI